MSDKILDSLCQLKIKDNQRLPRRFSRRPFLPRLQKVCLTFVFLSALSSAMKWRRGRRKSGKRERRRLACQVSECTTRCSTTSLQWRIYRFRWRYRFDDATFLTETWLWYIPYKFWLRLHDTILLSTKINWF